MTDPAVAAERLDELISELDPSRYEVAVAHLRDAVDALHASLRDKPTRYARSDQLVNGSVVKLRPARTFK